MIVCQVKSSVKSYIHLYMHKADAFVLSDLYYSAVKVYVWSKLNLW